jgi:DNA-binding MarR family transcriptional regulator
MKRASITDGRIGYLLKRAQAALRTRMDAVLDRRGLTTPQYSVLSTLERAPGSSNAELARLSFVTPQTMMRILDNLESLGFIVREPHASHGRILVTSLTALGRKTVAACHGEINEIEEQMLDGLTTRERGALQELLLHCVAALRGD